MKRNILSSFLLAFLMILAGCSNHVIKKGSSASAYPEEQFGWKLGAQAYTFNRFTFFDAIDKIDSCNLKYVEGFPGQNLGGGLEGKLDYNMDAALRDKILAKLKDKGVKIVAYGVVSPKGERDWRQLFEFGKAMGIETFTSEPAEEDLELVSSLCDEYKINVAIHNHPNPSHYWNPDIVLAAIEGKSNRLGSCADIGHWIRSGLDPIECLKKLDGHILHSHMKDLNEKSKKAHDVIWGTGISNIDGIIRELKRQKFKGMISVEYEYNWDNSAPEVAESVKYFRVAVKEKII